MTMLLPQLTIIRFVLRNSLGFNPRDEVGATISDFLIADVSLSCACSMSPIGSSALLNLVWTRSLRDAESSGWSLARLLQTEAHYYQWDFSRALIHAVRRDDLGMLQWLLVHFPGSPITQDIVEEAARGGHLGMLQLFVADRTRGDVPWSESSVMGAARGRHWSLARWLLDRADCTPEAKKVNNELVCVAFTQNNIEQVKWAIAKGFGVDKFSFPDCTEAEWVLRTEILRYVLDGGYGDVGVNALMAFYQAAKLGDLCFMQWLMSRHVTRREELVSVLVGSLNAASSSGHLSVVEWLVTYLNAIALRYDPSEAMFEAAQAGRLEVTQFLQEYFSQDWSVDLFKEQKQNVLKDDPTPCTAMDIAAKNGHLDVLIFLHSVNVESRKRQREEGGKMYFHRDLRCTSTAMDAAASNGHLGVVKWLHTYRSEGCTSAAMNYAAANGHFEVVQWLLSTRNECDAASALDSAADRYFRIGSGSHSPEHTCCVNIALKMFYERQLMILQWLHSRTSAQCTSVAMDGAAANGDLNMLKWLHLHTTGGCTTKAMDSAARLGHLDVVKWLHVYRWEGCSTNAMDGAATSGRLEVVKWLYRNRPEGCTARAMDGAAARGHLSVVKWIFSHCAGVRVKSAMAYAALWGHFEVVLFLHSHLTRNFSYEELLNVKTAFDRRSQTHPDYKNIQSWFEENYPLRIDRTGQQCVPRGQMRWSRYAVAS